MKCLTSVRVALMIACVAVTTQVNGGTIIDRGLPDSNLNNVAGGDRSNVAWGFDGDYLAGDDFTLPALDAGMAKWRLDKISVWTIGGESSLGDRFDSISLFLGPDGGSIPSVMSANLTGGNATDNPNVSVTDVTYSGGELYQAAGGDFRNIWQIDFMNVGDFDPGLHLFALGGSGGIDDPIMFAHASNAGLSGTTQDGADDRYRWFGGSASDPFVTVGNFLDSDGNGWDKSSDINIVVTGRQVPEPTSLAIMAFAAIGLVAARRFRANS